MRAGTFFFPGPTEVRDEVLRAMLRQPIPHRSDAFRELFARVETGLRAVFCTERPVYIATASGTGMMEAAVRCAPEGRILALVNGAFAERFERIAIACGRAVDRHDVPIGDVPRADEVRDLLQSRAYSAVTVVHSETSTGALTDVSSIASMVHASGAVLIVDSVSGVGGARLDVRADGLDCVVSASQKALALPPGLAFATTTDAFLEGAARVRDRGVYLDLRDFDAYARRDETPSTPSVSLIFALEYQLDCIAREGIAARWARHDAMRIAMEQWVANTADSLGVDISILARSGSRSPTVTVVRMPDGVPASTLVAGVAKRGYTIGNGYGTLREATFRVGHMGDHTVTNLEACLASVADALGELCAARAPHRRC